MTTMIREWVLQQMSDTLREGCAIAAEICRATNLQAVVPIWCDGEHIKIGAVAEVHSRPEWATYGEARRSVGGVWTASGRDGIAEVVADAVAAARSAS